MSAICNKPLLLVSLVIASLCGGARAGEPHLHDTFLARVEVLASMETLSANLLASRSATKALEEWCSDHQLALPAKIHAEAVKAPEKPIRPEQRAHLQVGPDEPIRYRRVRLTCGTHVLSEADNWYVPSRLTPEMNRVLETTDTPFGKAVAALGFTRETLAVETVWSPLQPGWETHAPPVDHPDEELELPLILFEHQAVLYDSHHLPFSEVDEHYMRDNLSFPRAE